VSGRRTTPGRVGLLFLTALVGVANVSAEGRRKVIIDQDCRGPATTDLLSTLALIQSPDTDVLAVSVVSGDQWRDEEVAHTLRLLEIIGRTDVPVVPGAVFPLINRKEEIARWEKLHGRVGYQGAWNEKPVGNYPGWWAKRGYFEPFFVPDLPEGSPTTRASGEDAAHFLIRMARSHPGEITIYAGGPLTNLALALAIDPEFPKLVKELVVMGASLRPVAEGTPMAEPTLHTPRREFNFWWDPEATRMVLRAPWLKVTVTSVDISVKTRISKALVEEIGRSKTPAAQYVAKWSDEQLMWDEVAALAWLDPSLITRDRTVYMDIDIDHGAGYGNTLSWPAGSNPGLGEQLVTLQEDLDLARFYAMFVDLMTRPTPAPAPAKR
jgi:inosine-uridine nucleoside N-ribohydrolase